MRTICKNCKHFTPHHDGASLCNKKICFVDKRDSCREFNTDEMFDPTKLVLFTVAVVAIVIFLSKIL